MYYKIIKDDTFVGVGTSYDLRRFQKKHKIILVCDEDSAEYIQHNDALYHTDWMRPVITDVFEFEYVYLEAISKDEYDILCKAIDSGEDIVVEDKTEDVIIDEPVVVDPSEVVTIEYVKSAKITEMSRVCNQVITNGVDCVLEDGNTYHFSLTTQDQLNLITLSTMVASGKNEIPYHADGELCKFYSAKDISIILDAATTYIMYHESYFNALRDYINSLNTIEEVSAITYGAVIPDAYMSDVLKVMSAQ